MAPHRYFTGNQMLQAAWFFLLASTPYLVDGVNLVVQYPTWFVGYTFLFAVIGGMATMSVWVIAFMPDSLISNGNNGSTFFFDQLFCKFVCCCLVRTKVSECYMLYNECCERWRERWYECVFREWWSKRKCA